MGTPEMHRHDLIISCVVYGTVFSVLSALSIVILAAVNWRPWRIYSWIFARKWPWYLQGPQLSYVAGVLCWGAWAAVVSPIVVLTLWGIKLIVLLDHDTIGLAVIMAGTALLLAFYAIMLWWRTQWQSSRAVFILLLLAVTLLCGYEVAAVYVSAGRSASHRYSPSAFFFGVSAIAMGINMLFICKMVYHGSGLDVDEYVRRSYKFAHADSIEVGPVACMPEPPDPRDPALQKKNRALCFATLYLGSVLVLLGYSILYGLTARKARWLGGVTSAAVMILDANVGACLFGFQLLKSPLVALIVAGVYRCLLICFGVYYWYLGHCISYGVVATVLLGAAVRRHLSVMNPAAARIAALDHTVVRLREGFRKKGLGSSSSFSDGRTSSAMRSSSVEAAQVGVALEAMNRMNLRHPGEVPHSGLACPQFGSLASQHGAIGVIEECVEDASSPLPSENDQATGEQTSVMTTNEGNRPDPTTDLDTGLIPGDKQGLSERHRQYVPDLGHSLESFTSFGGMEQLDHLAIMFQERLNDPRITSMLRHGVRRGGEQDLTTLLEDKGLDPNFAVMLKEKGLDPTLLALLQRSSLDADRDHRDNTEAGAGGNPSEGAVREEVITWSEELRMKQWEKWIQPIRFLVNLFAGTPERAWILFSVVFVQETIFVAIFRPQTVTVINASHEQFEFGFSALLLSPVACSIMAFFWSLQAEEMRLTSRPRKIGFGAWLLSTSVGLLLAFLSKSSIILGLALAVPLIVASLSVAIPLWIRNGFRFHKPPVRDTQSDGAQHSQSVGLFGQKENLVMTLAVLVCLGSIIALAGIISFKPLDELSYSGWNGKHEKSVSPYTSSLYLGWAIASALVLILTGMLPAVSWFATYRFTLSSAVCVAVFIVVLVTFCGGSYVAIVHSHDDKMPTKADFLAALLPLVCIPAVFSLGCGLYKWKDEGWQLSRGVYACVGVGLLLLLGAISAVIATINPWMIGVAFLLFLLLLVLTIVVIHHWASHNFYLTRVEMVLVSLATLVLALAAFAVGLIAEEPFVGASVGYFAFLFLLAGRSLTVLLSPPVVVYSPRVLPVYIYDAHADCAKNVSGAFLVLYAVALGTAGWGVVASLEIYPPFAGAAVSAITLVVAFGFAVSRPQTSLKTMEDALHFLRIETVVQAIARSSTKTRNALSGTYSAPQRSASSAALLVGDASVARDKAGNFVLPRADVLKLRERLRNEEHAAGLYPCRAGAAFIRHDATADVGYRRKLCAHARILALEEAIDTEWVYMWDKFGGYLLLVLGLAAIAERVQDEVRLRLFLDSIGFSDLSAKEINKWTPEDRKRFEIVQEDYMREKEMEEELMQQRREEEGKGKERRKALLEKEERRRREVEASVISSVPDVGTKEAIAMAAAVRAVGGDVLFDDSKAGEDILRRIFLAQRARRAQETGVPGTQCIIDDEPRSGPRPCGVLDSSVCGSRKVTFSAAVLVQPESGPICLLGSETRQLICWEILIAGAEQGLEAGQVGLRLVVKGSGQTTSAREWNIGNTCLADGRWHTVTVTLDAEIGEAAAYLDGEYDGFAKFESLNGLQQPAEGGIWEDGTEVWVGIRPPMDLDAFGRSDSEGADSRMHVMDVFLWGRLLNEEEIVLVHDCTSMSQEEYNDHDLPEDGWRSPVESPLEDWSYDATADLDLYDRETMETYWDEEPTNGRKRKLEKESVALEMDHISRKLRRPPRVETQEEVAQKMRAVELAVKEALAARGETHFTDQEFPPTNQSLYVDPEHPLPKFQAVTEWLRTGAALKDSSPVSQPCLFAGPPNSSDVCQGRLGDCWFLSAVAVLTETSKISDVIVTPEFNEEGIYTVRFCIQGEWVAVVVDDWIPCEGRGKPAFAKSRKRNELWVSILEKAYAKLHGSYEALEGGVVQDALVDLTGGAGEEIDLTQSQLELASGRLWSQMLRFKQEGFLLGAGSPSGSDTHVSSSGIVQGHAYALLQIREVDGHKLVQIRNPWANDVEWNGPWSDLSSEWTDRMKHKLKYTPQAEDGVFWMSWQDFQLHFRSLYVCRIYPPEMRYLVRGQWRSSSAGGCQDYNTWHHNPQFHIKAVGADARQRIHVFITLTQGVRFSSKSRPGFRNYQSGGDSSLFFIGMRIIKTRGRRSGPNIFMHEAVTGTDYINTREIPCEIVLEPDPDGYTIVPTTIAPGQECQFLLSVFTKASITLEPL
ncbi:calpain-type cysteine protease DEK1 [Marchantia polymorpha subsp. ruderalis]|uniref:Calpain catalytic domain-containing protein n=1 Tax=Marchantia polymorpha TaxID=3197 RepID=A0A2R6XAY6_MARPO|nr:hypothetical protein MARPO_0026s0110 [Marchantia polymorpha]|eukprot:PTQ43239.1 hypothetical protein MARPO_0026s0110 [Marchantia polymorpha]